MELLTKCVSVVKTRVRVPTGPWRLARVTDSRWPFSPAEPVGLGLQAAEESDNHDVAATAEAPTRRIAAEEDPRDAP